MCIIRSWLWANKNICVIIYFHLPGNIVQNTGQNSFNKSGKAALLN